ncbi:MAG TPA: MazG family protein [Candidatus Dormibacteraeota bacterium]|nr:MazG family protein [Candidatus Dormibacteraeota bacterium]
MTDAALQELRRLFEVMERLRAPGGCPWDRSQTHQTLVPFLLEETYEAIQAVERGGPDELAEELGDLLVEVAMHSAIAAEAGTFDIGTVARTATEKMIGRHPHVFGELEVDGVAQVVSNWEELKRKEKPDRESVLDGIPDSLPALALAAAIQRRQPQDGGVGGSGRPEPLLEPAQAATRALADLVQLGAGGTGADALVGELLFSVVAVARERGVDAEGALRRLATAQRQVRRRSELQARPRAPSGPRQGESPEPK